MPEQSLIKNGVYTLVVCALCFRITEVEESGRAALTV